MSKGKRFKAEQIVHKLREADVLIGQGPAVPRAWQLGCACRYFAGPV